MEDVSRLKQRPLCGPSYPASQAGKTASTFPFSTGNTLPARSRHGTRRFRNFIMLLPERHLMSPKPSFFLLCHFQACRLQQKIQSLASGPAPHTPTFHLIFIVPAQMWQLFLYSSLIFFTLILSFGVNWKRHQYLPIFNGNSLMNI